MLKGETMVTELQGRFELPLHNAIDLVLSNAELRLEDIEYNLFYIIDKPGAGKTRTIESKVRERGWGFLSYSPALERIEKFGGIPDLKRETIEKPYLEEAFDPTIGKHYPKKCIEKINILKTEWSIPQMIVEINECAEQHPICVVLLDDWHLCDEDIQKIGFELFTYYKLNNNPIHKNVVFVLAGNETSAAGARVQLSAIRNRSTILYTKSDVKYWINNFALPNRLHPMGISFFQSIINEEYFQEEETAYEQFGSPRSWTSAFNLISKIENSNFSNLRNYIFAIIQGSVSRIAAEKFMIHFDLYRNINLQEVFEQGIIRLPKDTIELYCYITALTYSFFDYYYSGKVNKKTLLKIYGTFITQLIDKQKEMSTTAIITLANLLTKDREKSGMEILSDLIGSKYIDETKVKELTKITKVLGKVA